MKKLTAAILMLALALSFAGCKKEPVNVTIYTSSTEATTGSIPEETQQTTQALLPEAEYNGNMISVALPYSAEKNEDENGTQISRYESQYMALVHPDSAVADKIILNFQSRQDAFRSDANNILSQAEQAFTGNQNWSPYFYAVAYEPTRVDQTVLSLFGSKVSWSGTPHPDRTCVFANYDMVTGDVLTLGSILTHEDQTDNLKDLLIGALSEIAEEKSLFSGYESTVSARFQATISYDELWYFDQNGLCFAFSPYEIAPYSQGIISVTIPYDQLTGIIADSYFPPERDVSSGAVSVSWPTGEEIGNLSGLQIAEVVLDRDGEMILLKTDRLVYDLRLELGQWDAEGNPTATCYTVFGSDVFSSQMAVMVQAKLTSEDSYLRLSYLQGEEIIFDYIAAID